MKLRRSALLLMGLATLASGVARAAELKPGATFSLSGMPVFQVECFSKVELGLVVVVERTLMGGAKTDGKMIQILPQPKGVNETWATYFLYGNKRCRTSNKNLKSLGGPDTQGVACVRPAASPLKQEQILREVKTALSRASRITRNGPCDAEERFDKVKVELAERGSAVRSCRLGVMQTSDSGKYRGYSLSSDGMFQVFDSFGSGSNSSSTGARVYFLFPRKQKPDFKTADGKIVATAPSGETLEFSSENGFITGSSLVGLREDRQVNGANNGGVEISRSSRGVVLDCGWKKGGSPHSDLNRTSTVIDPSGKRCTVSNRLIFKPYAGEPRIPRTDRELYDVFTQQCPGLDLSSLK